MSLSIVVSIPVCHTEDRSSIPRNKELLEINTSFHKITDSTFGVHIFRKKKTGQRLSEKARGNEHQINISVSKEESFPACHTGNFDSPTFDVSKFKPEKMWRMTEKKTKVEKIFSPTCRLV